jgi:hypothetical protein
MNQLPGGARHPARDHAARVQHETGCPGTSGQSAWWRGISKPDDCQQQPVLTTSCSNVIDQLPAIQLNKKFVGNKNLFHKLCCHFPNQTSISKICKINLTAVTNISYNMNRRLVNSLPVHMYRYVSYANWLVNNLSVHMFHYISYANRLVNSVPVHMYRYESNANRQVNSLPVHMYRYVSYANRYENRSDMLPITVSRSGLLTFKEYTFFSENRLVNNATKKKIHF